MLTCMGSQPNTRIGASVDSKTEESRLSKNRMQSSAVKNVQPSTMEIPTSPTCLNTEPAPQGQRGLTQGQHSKSLDKQDGLKDG